MTTNNDDYALGGWNGPEGPYEWVDEIQWGEASYDFDISTLWRNKDTGELVMADDSGCSCPSPHEDTRVSDTTKITNLVDFDKYIDLPNRYSGTYPASVDELVAMRKKVEALLNS